MVNKLNVMFKMECPLKTLAHVKTTFGNQPINYCVASRDLVEVFFS